MPWTGWRGIFVALAVACSAATAMVGGTAWWLAETGRRGSGVGFACAALLMIALAWCVVEAMRASEAGNKARPWPPEEDL